VVSYDNLPYIYYQQSNMILYTCVMYQQRANLCSFSFLPTCLCWWDCRHPNGGWRLISVAQKHHIFNGFLWLVGHIA